MSRGFIKSLTYYQRSAPRFSTNVTPLVSLLPRATFEGHPDVLEAYDLMDTYNATILGHRRKAIEAGEASRLAQIKYDNDVTAAVEAGKDAATIKNAAPARAAQAESHKRLAEKVLTDATAHGYVFGELMAEAAVDCYPASEQAMADAALDVRGSIASLRASWATWSEAWAVRRNLSTMAVRGGQQFGFESDQAVPREVAEALTIIEGHLNALEELKEDEAAVAEFRAANQDLGLDRRAVDVKAASRV